MKEKIQQQISEIASFSAETLEEVEAFRIKYLGKKGILSRYFADFREVPADQKKDYWKWVTDLKNAATEKVNDLKATL